MSWGQWADNLFSMATVIGCERGIEHGAEINEWGWEAFLSVPWEILLEDSGSSTSQDFQLPSVWRANFYRIDNRKGTPDQEFSCCESYL
jgi:hypothetical protein